LPQLQEDSRPAEVEDDWLTNFFDKCRLISDDDMQTLWSRVLAGEANSPGKYSKRTVSFLSDLDKTDADLFTRACGFAWSIGKTVPLIYDEQHEIYNKQGITFDTLSHLASIGLMNFESLGFKFLRLPKIIPVSYYGTLRILEMPQEQDNEVSVGKLMLTKIGSELAAICGGAPVDGFLDYVSSVWESKGYKIIDPLHPPEKPDTPSNEQSSH
jgi:hypothetical protein